MKAFLPVFLALLLISTAFAVSDDEKAKNVLKNAAARLGWPETISMDEDDNVGSGITYTISPEGTGSDEDLHGSIAVFSTDQEPVMWLTFMDEQFDMDRGSYQGRDAVISRYGKNCNPQGLVKVMNDMVVGFFESIFGPSDEPNCVTEHGVIVWTCGKYFFAANDARDDEGGEEDNIAAAIYAAAQEEGLCEYGDTLVVMIQTPDSAGSDGISDQALMAQKVNEYYGVVSYGQYPPFKFTFLDADGSRGLDDWYTLTSTMASFNNNNNKFNDFEDEAVKKVFDGKDVPEDLYFERIVLVYSGPPLQTSPGKPFYDACDWKKDSDYVEVQASSGKRKIYSKNFVFLSEESELGQWVHEFGHSLPSRYTMPAPRDSGRICDRYNYAPYTYGEVNDWGLMGYGVWWPNDATKPVHMEGFSKVSANWLEYSSASLNQTYVLQSLEDMKKGDTVLKLDDPVSSDADHYYVIEARDPSAYFGAPESGVVIYKVSKTNGYHTVNAIAPQASPARTTNAQGRDYQRPTLFDTSGNGSVYIDVPGNFKVTMTSESDKASTIKIEQFSPINLIGALMGGAGGGVGAMPGISQSVNPSDSPPMDSSTPEPDLDLHAYDPMGNHVGMDYQSGIYENEIPGAYSSGDLIGADEWIFVPQGTSVRFEVSTYDTQRFLSANPAYSSLATPQGYQATAVRFDYRGVRSEAELGNGSAGAGQSVQLKSPDDPSLEYIQKDISGVGNNAACPLMPGLVLALLGAVSLKR
ncbi:MAG: hypothetical protein V1827_01810 [Candidatus Micrarchaeota archaeon]